MDRSEHVESARMVYDHSAAQYVEAVGTELSTRFETALDRALLGSLAEHLSAQGAEQVLDMGCGTGRVTSYLAARGLDVYGVDISAEMIAAARRAHPDLTFELGSLTDVPMADRSFGAVVYWYSIIATPLLELPSAWAELDRLLTGDGQVLVAFQAGDNDCVEQPDAYGSSVTLTLYRHRMADVAGSLEAAGFEVRARVLRQPELAHETTPQAFLFAHRRRP